MTTWDEIKKETERKATKLWADDESSSSAKSPHKSAADDDESFATPSTETKYDPAKFPHKSAADDDESFATLSTETKYDPAKFPHKSAADDDESFATPSTKTKYDPAKFPRKSFVAAVLGADSVDASADAGAGAGAGADSVVASADACAGADAGADTDAHSVVAVPGDPIGIRSIQSIMMSATQMNLSHFHTAGMSSSSLEKQHNSEKNTGCPSVSGLFSNIKPTAADAMNSTYTKSNTSMKFMMQSEGLDKFQQLRYLRKHLVGASLGHFVRKIGSNITELPDRENIWYKTKTNSRFEITEVSGIVLRIYIDYNKMYNHGLTLENLAQEVFGNDCSWNVSPDFMGMIDISVQVTYISQWLSRIKHRVCGTSDVLSCDYDEYKNFTVGTNVLAACKVPGIDKTTIELNNVISVEKHFGIEAAAKILADLTGNVIVSDFMARKGRVLPFSKYSSEVSSKGLLTSMGFERPKDDIRNEINKLGQSRSRTHRISIRAHNHGDESTTRVRCIRLGRGAYE